MALRHFITILRPLNCAMAAFGTLVGYSIASSSIQFNFAVAVAMAVAFLVCAGGMVVNDYYDREIDRKLHPDKPIVTGAIKPLAALAYASLLLLLGNLLAFHYLTPVAFAIAFTFSMIFIVYSRLMAKAKYLGNFVVASGTAFTLVFGASLIGNYAVIGFLAAAALFANTARELIKDLEDVEADRSHKVTLPMLLQQKSVESIIFIYYAAAIVFVYIPVFLLAFGKLFFVAVVSVANLLFLLSFGKTVKKQFRQAQTLSKAAMLLALLGFLAGAI